MGKRNKAGYARPKKLICDPNVCDNCLYIGEGDFVCELTMEIVMDEWSPTEKFLHCQNKK